MGLMLSMAEREGYGGTVPQPRHRPTANTVTSADIARVSVRTIYRWVKSNRVEWVRTAGGHLRVYVDTLLRVPKE